MSCKKDNFVLFLHTSDSMTWIPCTQNDKFSYFYHLSPFERSIIFKESLFDFTYLYKIWNKLYWEVFWKTQWLSILRTIDAAKMELFAVLLSSFQSLINFTKNHNIGDMAVLNTPVEYYNIFRNLYRWWN